MKRLNRKFIKGTNWALAGILTFFGFSACSDDDDGGEPMLEYGTPYASFVVKGKVTDAAGNSLQGIQVVVPAVDHCQRTTSGFIPDQSVITKERGDTLYTASNGEFEYKYGGFPTDTVRIHMKFADISIDPHYKSDSTKVSFLLEDLKDGDNRWNQGNAEKIIQVKLDDR